MTAGMDDQEAPDAPASRRAHILRLAVFAGFLAVVFYLVAVARVIDVGEIRAVVSATGPAAPLTYVVASALAGALFVPGSILAAGSGLLFGPLLRLAGADVVVFPSFGGRFSFTRTQCEAIAEGLRRPFGDVPAALPAPGGGMGLDRVPELLDTYGQDVVLLIGGELHRGGDLRRAAEEFRAAVER